MQVLMICATMYSGHRTGSGGKIQVRIALGHKRLLFLKRKVYLTGGTSHECKVGLECLRKMKQLLLKSEKLSFLAIVHALLKLASTVKSCTAPCRLQYPIMRYKGK